MTSAVAERSARASATRTSEEAALPARPPRLLIISDTMEEASHPDLASLREAGYHLQMATSGIEALGRAIARRPDLVILDVQPARMQGLDVVRRLKAAAATRPIPVIALIGRDGDVEATALEAGCEVVLRKPCRPGQLATAVQRHLHGRRPPPRRRGRCGRS